MSVDDILKYYLFSQNIDFSCKLSPAWNVRSYFLGKQIRKNTIELSPAEVFAKRVEKAKN